MSCCCIKTLNLCNVPVCESLVLDQLAEGVAASGTLNNYKLVLDFLNIQINLTEEQTEGEQIHFDVSELNESFEYTGKIYDSEGNEVKITVDGIEYDCIKFKTLINVTA